MTSSATLALYTFAIEGGKAINRGIQLVVPVNVLNNIVQGLLHCITPALHPCSCIMRVIHTIGCFNVYGGLCSDVAARASRRNAHHHQYNQTQYSKIIHYLTSRSCSLDPPQTPCKPFHNLFGQTHVTLTPHSPTKINLCKAVGWFARHVSHAC